MNEVYQRAIGLVAAGAVDLRRLVSDRRPLDEAADAMAHATARTGIKTVIVTRA